MIDHPGQKLIFPAKLVPIDTLVSAWGTPYEFWLLSTLENGHSASIIIDDKPEDRTWAAYTPAALVVNWYLYPYKELNPKYFIFNDSTSGYKVVPAQQQ